MQVNISYQSSNIIFPIPFLFRNKGLLLVVLVSAILSGCTHECSDGCKTSGLDDNCCPTIDTLVKTRPKASIKSINIFLETSGSMFGYMPNSQPATEFQKIIPDILAALSTQYSGKVNFYSIYDSKTAFNKLGIETATGNILSGNFSQGGNTYLPIMLDSILRYLKKDEVNILISDCIYSPESKDKKEREIASTDIRTKIKPISDTFSTTAFCFFSEFRNKKHHAERSPYYLILQGKSENIQDVEHLILKSLETAEQSYEEVNYGLNYARPYYSILPLTEITSNFMAYPCDSFQSGYVSLQTISMETMNDSIKFWLGIDLKGFPNYAQEISYLDSNLSLTIANGKIKILAVSKVPPKGLITEDKPISDRCTHFIQMSVSDLSNCITTVDISLNYAKPAWIVGMNESSDEDNRSKTFGLDRINSGFEQAYNPTGKTIFFNNLSIALIKQKL